MYYILLFDILTTFSIINMVSLHNILYKLVYTLLWQNLIFLIPFSTVNLFLYFSIPKLWFLHEYMCYTTELSINYI